jgi:hypothetical protein
MEANEIDEFTKQVKEGGESHMRWVSLAISVLAVFVALVTVMGHRMHTEAVLEQARASDTWNEYQAKKIRQSQLSGEVSLLTLQPNANSSGVEKRVEDDKKHIEKWNDDLKEEQEKAHELEASVRNAERQATRYDLGEALLQIAVVLSSITLLTRQKLFAIAGVTTGLCGLLIAATALLIR